jgi:hypothetical protein
VSARARFAAAALLVAAVVGLYSPVLSFELMGDDYQWVQHAHAAMHRPHLLFTDLDTFYRPANTWTLVVDRLLWPSRPLGYHLTNLLLQALAGLGLVAAARRLGLFESAAWALGALWALSPFALEPAASVAIRFENLLFLAWLGLVITWPRADESWTLRRVAAAASMAGLALFSKETWVVTPGVVLALELGVRHVPLRRALRTATPFAGAVLAYVACYFLAFPSDKSYFAPSFAVLAKVPHQLAAFLYLETLVPLEFPFSGRGAFTLAAVSGAIVLGLRRSSPAHWLGAALLILPTIPTLLVPFLPTRYTAIPYAGFLVVAAATVLEPCARLSGRLRILLLSSTGAFALVVLTAGIFTVRSDLADLDRVSQAHHALLTDARRVQDSVRTGLPAAVVRGENLNPLREVALSVRGLPKLFYVRHPDPSGLVDAAALFEWVIGREGTAVQRFDDGESRFKTVPGLVLVHRPWGFEEAVPVPDLGALAADLRQGGSRFRIVRARQL